MASHAHTTGAPTRAPAFADFQMSRFDHLSGEVDTLKSLIWVAVDLVAAKEPHGENLLHAALNQLRIADDQLQAIHSDLIACKQEANNA